jgi:hypothetical protein
MRGPSHGRNRRRGRRGLAGSPDQLVRDSKHGFRAVNSRRGKMNSFHFERRRSGVGNGAFARRFQSPGSSCSIWLLSGLVELDQLARIEIALLGDSFSRIPYALQSRVGHHELSSDSSIGVTRVGWRVQRRLATISGSSRVSWKKLGIEVSMYTVFMVSYYGEGLFLSRSNVVPLPFQKQAKRGF